VNKRRSLYGATVLIAILAVGAYTCGEKVFAGTDTDVRSSAPAQQKPAQKNGEQVFMENCSRCHKPPMSISPRITGTVVMHMRVRAKLSRQDEQALLRYLAP
jgi:cytochrome c5